MQGVARLRQARPQNGKGDPPDQVHVVPLEKARDDVGAKRKRDAAVVLAPARDVLVGIRPEEVAQEARLGHVGRPHHPPDLVHRLEVGRKAAMHAQNLFVDDGRDRQAVEAVGKRLPELDVIPPLALVVEAVDAVDRGALVVAAEDEEVFGVLDLVREQETDGLERLLAAVDVVTKEEVVRFRRLQSREQRSVS